MARTAETNSGSPRFGFLLVAAILAGLLVLAAGALLTMALRQPPGGSQGSLLSASVGGPFNLTDQNGKAFTAADLKGKWHLVFFGYTHCPDVCPTTLNELSLAIDKLPKERQKEVGIVFVSVDPARDTPAVLKSYVGSFDGPITGLTGTAAEVKQAAKEYHVYYAKHERADGGYDMDHSAVVYVMDPQGRFTGTITPDTAAPQITTKLQKLLS
jgi:protein SCO1/2